MLQAALEVPFLLRMDSPQSLPKAAVQHATGVYGLEMVFYLGAD